MTNPFFETPPLPGARRLLLVTYSFPPDAKVGALRWEMMLRFAAEFDWKADVLLMDPAESDGRDESRLATLPAGLRLFGVPFPKSSLDTVMTWRRRMLGLRRQPAPSSPDFAGDNNGDQGGERSRWQRVKRDVAAWNHYHGWQRWARRAARVALDLARDADYACVVSSGPPHMAHEAARRIASAISRPLILDFRDPWTSAEAEPPDMGGEAWRTLSHRYERACVSTASLITVNTESAGRYMRALYPEHAHRVITVRNGADPIPAPPPFPAKPFTISYTGALYGGRRPKALFRALRLIVERDRLSRDDIHLHFMGVEEPQRVPVQELAREEGIESIFTCETRRPRAEANALLDRSAMLVLLPQTWVHSVPAKLFEYVQRPAWLLVLSEPGTAMAELLGDTTADIIPPDDVEAIAAAITRRLHEARSGVRPQPLNADGRFSREKQATLFFEELDRVVQRSPQRAGT
jgi:glycosyltransferase involved in cell wall biosynthesis